MDPNSLFGKARVLVLGNMHALLNRAIDLNSMEVVDQYVRDLNDATNEVGDALAIARGRESQTKMDITVHQAKMTETESNITLLLNDDDPTNDPKAEELEARLIGYESELRQLETRLNEQGTLVTGLEETNRRLHGKLTEMRGALRQLRSMEESTKATEQAADALKMAKSVGATDATASIDNAAQRIKDRSTVANARFKRALGEMADSVDVTVVQAQAKERIAARRKAQEKPTEPATTSTS